MARVRMLERLAARIASLPVGSLPMLFTAADDPAVADVRAASDAFACTTREEADMLWRRVYARVGLSRVTEPIPRLAACVVAGRLTRAQAMGRQLAMLGGWLRDVSIAYAYAGQKRELQPFVDAVTWSDMRAAADDVGRRLIADFRLSSADSSAAPRAWLRIGRRVCPAQHLGNMSFFNKVGPLDQHFLSVSVPLFENVPSCIMGLDLSAVAVLTRTTGAVTRRVEVNVRGYFSWDGISDVSLAALDCFIRGK